MKEKMLFAVNRWTLRDTIHPYYLRWLALWNIDENNVQSSVKNCRVKIYKHNSYTHEEILMQALYEANAAGIPYLGMLDDDAYIQPEDINNHVIPTFEAHPKLAQLGYAGCFQKLRIKEKPELAKAMRGGFLVWNRAPWATPAINYYRVRAAMQSNLFTAGVRVMEDSIAAWDLRKSGWDLGLLFNCQYWHKRGYRRLCRTFTEKDYAEVREKYLHAERLALRRFPNQLTLVKRKVSSCLRTFWRKVHEQDPS